jgi:SAM-dependent methyltransferase
LRIEADRVLRTVHPEFAATTQSFLNSALAHELTDSGWLVATRSLGFQEDGSLELEHKRVFFPSYPWEWCAEQWIDAAVVTLDICDKLLDHGLILKDATPLNILFDGSRPVLVDVLSIEGREPANPLWNAYGQFVRTFVLPLIAHKRLGWPLAATYSRRDGYEPDELYPYLQFAGRWLGPSRRFITLPVLLDRMGKSSKFAASVRFSDEASIAILRSRLRSLKRTVLGLHCTNKKSRWSGYAEHRDHYSKDEGLHKEAFVKKALGIAKAHTVLDLGANTGAFSRLAAASGAQVVAVDTDVASTSIHYKNAHRSEQPILPLFADIARPTPPAGWKNQESLSLLERCRQRFDCVMMLGILHHLLVSDQIPLGEIATLVFDLAPRWIIVEWIPPTDPKFVEICRGRDALYSGLTEASFHEKFALYFHTIEREVLSNGRVLLLMEAR